MTSLYNLWSRYDLHVVGHDVVLREVNCEDLSHYLNEIESIG